MIAEKGVAAIDFPPLVLHLVVKVNYDHLVILNFALVMLTMMMMVILTSVLMLVKAVHYGDSFLENQNGKVDRLALFPQLRLW